MKIQWTYSFFIPFFVFTLYFNKKSEVKRQFSSVGVAVTRYQQMRNVPIQNELSVTPHCVVTPEH